MTERSLWWVKEKKHMASVFMIVTMMLQFQTKGCVGCLDSERIGLLQLKSYLVNVLHVKEENILQSWSHGDNSSDCCVWKRVNCDDSIGGHIVDLSLDEMIPANYSTLPRPLNLSLLHSFPQLKTFSFSENYFTHLFDPIHGYKSFQRLRNLRNLDLSFNSLDNSVLPFLSAASSLRNLNLEYNNLDGVFPPNGLMNLTELEELNLSYNLINKYDFRTGYKSFQRLKKLRTLDLSFNEHNNSVVPFLSAAISLRTLKLGSNQLKGVINMNVLRDLPELQELDLSNNDYTDFTDLDSLGAMLPSSLQVLNLASNRLSFIPKGYSEICRLMYLRELDLSRNSLASMPSCLNNTTSLRTLHLFSNDFTDFDSLGAVLPSSLQVLSLAFNQLSFIPKGYSEICRLLYLQELSLRGNDLTILPSCLGNLTRLRELGLSGNALTSLPYSLGNLTRLRTLDLSYNQLNGSEEVSSFVHALPSALEYLSLLQNNFSGSFLFSSLINKTRLTVFRMSSKVGRIQAQAESSWVPLFQLKELELHNFNLGSTIPGFLIHQHDLSFVDLSFNNLTIAFPTWLVQNNTRLQMLFMNNNSLTKLPLPRIVHGLEALNISSNKIVDSIQEDIGNVFPNLTYMNFAFNHFRGAIPSSMGEMKSLQMLDMSFNDLSGLLPETFLSGCYSLKILKLSNNHFGGEVLPEYANLTGLEMLSLGGNSFKGSLGKGLLNSKSLELLDVSDNCISGDLPLWIERMSSLWYLYVRGNRLKGPFPRQLQNLALEVLDISHNSFSGPIPRNFDFSSLKELRLQSNEFVGSIPDTLFNAKQLELLDLRNNNLSGMILNTIGKNSNLRFLLLGNNNLQSHIPEEICQLSGLGLLNLSYNKLKGVMPPCLGNMFSGEEIPADLWVINTVMYIMDVRLSKNWSYTSAILGDGLTSDSQRHPTSIVDFLTKGRYEAYHGDIIADLCGLDLSSNQLSGEIPMEIGNLLNIKSLNFSNNQFTGSIPDSISRLMVLESLDLSNNNLDGKIPPQLADLNSVGFFNVSYNNLSGAIPVNGHLLTFDEKSYIGNVHLCGLPTKKSCNPSTAPEQAKEEEEENDGVIDMLWFYWSCGAVYITTLLALFAFLCIDTSWSREWFYHVDLVIHHLQRLRARFLWN